MANKSKNQIAQTMFSDVYSELSAGEKAAVTKRYNAQGVATPRVGSASAGISATIGRLGKNGTQTCLLQKGSTVQDLLTQSGYGFDSKKERILNQDTGNAVDLDDKVQHNGTYAIAVEIRSA